MTLSFIPKLLALVIVLFIIGPWMLRILVTFSERLFMDIPGLVG
jgi:flagellar biosynthetic protein FliQ